jgi:hypothetical protein
VKRVVSQFDEAITQSGRGLGFPVEKRGNGITFDPHFFRTRCIRATACKPGVRVACLNELGIERDWLAMSWEYILIGLFLLCCVVGLFLVKP